MKTENKIFDISFEFALQIVDAYKFLKSKNEFIMSKQLLRCGTSIGANINEAQAAQSRKDFITKMSIASKEARETSYWLKLLEESGYFNEYTKIESLIEFNNSIINILTKIVKTLQEKLNK